MAWQIRNIPVAVVVKKTDGIVFSIACQWPNEMKKLEIVQIER